MSEPSQSNAAGRVRLFFALWPTEKQRQAIVRATRVAVKGSGGKPVPAENLHITLAYLGQIEAPRVTAIREVAAGVHGCAFELEMDQLGHWPRPRILWLAPSNSPPGLAELVDSLWLALESCEIKREPRPFRAHMTLARKVSSRQRASQIRSVHWPVTDFMLVKSVTTPRYATYKVLDSWPLRKAPAKIAAD